MSDHVSAVNRLTASWLSQWPGGSGVLSGAGLWPLLAILAASADEPGRTELAEAVGVDAAEAMQAARLVLETMDAADGVDAALGLWAQTAAGVRAQWRAELPASSFGELTGDAGVDQPRLDAWARERTGGLIERFPVDAGPHLVLALATALSLRTTWERRFADDVFMPRTGPWQGRRLAGLRRTTPDLDHLVVASTPAGAVTLVRVAGDNGLDVHLALGEDGRRPAEVLARAVEAVAGTYDVVPGSALARADEPGGPGLSIVPAMQPGLIVATMRFTVRAEHDLLTNADVFGLTSVSTPADDGHFSRMAEMPMCVDQARQSAVAIFSAEGFEAAAVTAIGMRDAGAPIFEARALLASYDRPFGFVATHRATGLVLFAGWVADPEAAAR